MYTLGYSDSIVNYAQLKRNNGAEWRAQTNLATVADGAKLRIEGSDLLAFKVGKVQVRQRFMIADISDKILLGMDFYRAHDCVFDAGELTLQVDDQVISCTDGYGVPLAIHVKMKNTVTLQPQREMHVQTVMEVDARGTTGLVETKRPIYGILIARSLHQPQGKELILRMINTTRAPIEIHAHRLVGQYVQVEEVSEGPTKSPVSQSPQLHMMATDPNEPELPAHLVEHIPRWCENLAPEETRQVERLLCQYQDIFSVDSMDVGRTGMVKHSIPLIEGAQPVKQRPYRHGPTQDAEIERQVQDLAARDMIRPGQGAWSSPVVLVRKKDLGAGSSWRMCIDYRKVNSLTKKDAYPLPRIEDSLDALGGNKLFSTLDLTAGYWQVELDDDAKEKSAFVTRSGLWEFNVLPFGLTSAPACFERLMETVFRGMQWTQLLIYLDDIIVFASDLSTHLERLEEVFRRLKKAGLKVKPSKCHLLAKRVEYLGHVVDQHGIATDPKKVEAVKEWPRPQHITDVRSFLGTTGYYRKYIAGYAEIAKPLHHLLGKNVKFKWSTDCQVAMEKLQGALVNSPILSYPDFSLDFVLDTDASNHAVGAVLSQVQQGQEKVIAFFSKTLSKEEFGYCTTRKELLAVYKAVKFFRPYLYGNFCWIRTDHASLHWILMSEANFGGQVGRWIATLGQFSLDVKHRSGLKHQNADGLSRQLCKQCRQCEKAFVETTCTRGEASSQQLNALQIGEDTEASQAEMTRHQKEDSDIQPIYKVLQRNQTMTEEALRVASDNTRKLHRMLEHMHLEPNGQLVVALPAPKRRQDVLICPRKYQKEIIERKHATSHYGIHKTIARIRLHYYWPGMTADVRRYVSCCQRCQQGKLRKQNETPGKHYLHAGAPWRVLAIDLVGPLVKTPRGNTQLLVITDHFIKWADAIPITDGQASTVAQTLNDRVFAYFGLPEVLHSDQGRQFLSEVFRECCQIWGVDKLRLHPIILKEIQ